jgi:hypothetical protein
MMRAVPELEAGGRRKGGGEEEGDGGSGWGSRELMGADEAHQGWNWMHWLLARGRGSGEKEKLLFQLLMLETISNPGSLIPSRLSNFYRP